MEQRPFSMEQHERERWDVAAVLLFLQGSLAVLGALGLLVLTAALGLPPVGTILLALSGPLLMLLGAGLAAGWRWARRGAVIYQCFALAGFSVNLLLALLPQVRMETGLVVLLTNAALPAAILGLLLTPSSARAAARPTVETPVPAARRQAA